MTCEAFKAQGYHCGEAKKAGYTCHESKAAGYSCQQFKRAGYSCKEATIVGFTPHELCVTGEKLRVFDVVKEKGGDYGSYKPVEICKAHGLYELRQGGLTCEDLRAQG